MFFLKKVKKLRKQRMSRKRKLKCRTFKLAAWMTISGQLKPIMTVVLRSKTSKWSLSTEPLSRRLLEKLAPKFLRGILIWRPWAFQLRLWITIAFYKQFLWLAITSATIFCTQPLPVIRSSGWSWSSREVSASSNRPTIGTSLWTRSSGKLTRLSRQMARNITLSRCVTAHRYLTARSTDHMASIASLSILFTKCMPTSTRLTLTSLVGSASSS